VVVVVPPGAGLPDFGRYLMPVEGQLELDPDGDTGTNVPVLCRSWKSDIYTKDRLFKIIYLLSKWITYWTEPRTLKEYQISSSAPELHWTVAGNPNDDLVKAA
jgi:hypothetical protein